MGMYSAKGDRLGVLRLNKVAPADISMTNDLDLVMDILTQNPYPETKVKIINLSLDSPTLPKEHPNLIGGTVLLPPIDALCAEQDGDEIKYNKIYLSYFQDERVNLFMEALISALLLGTNIVMYIHDAAEFESTPRKLREVVGYLYGIHIGSLGQFPAQYEIQDPRCVKCWLTAAYKCNAITPREFMYLYPGTIIDSDEMLNKLIYDLCPMDDDKVKFIQELTLKLKEKPNLIVPMFQAIQTF